MTPRDAFPGYDDPVNIEGDPVEALKALITDESEHELEDAPEDDQAAEDESDE